MVALTQVCVVVLPLEIFVVFQPAFLLGRFFVPVMSAMPAGISPGVFFAHGQKVLGSKCVRYARLLRSCVGSHLGNSGLFFILLTADFPRIRYRSCPKASERSPALDLRRDLHGVEIGKTKEKRKIIKDVEGSGIASHRIMG